MLCRASFRESAGDAGVAGFSGVAGMVWASGSALGAPLRRGAPLVWIRGVSSVVLIALGLRVAAALTPFGHYSNE
jgi:hypothetical protein